MIAKEKLEHLYLKQGKSMQEIATALGCSVNKVQYWLRKHGVQTRTISDAVYLKNNPNGDPFTLSAPVDSEQAKLFGFGLGLYWGEGTKADKVSVRLGNTDPDLVAVFIRFLEVIFKIQRKDLHFSLQVFSDMPPERALDFWVKRLKIRKVQFYKTTVTPYRSIGTYRQKTKYGVIIVYYHNRKMRDVLMDLLQREAKVLLEKNTPL